jgi:myo-inositol-1(or 4)-monophosphatase
MTMTIIEQEQVEQDTLTQRTEEQDTLMETLKVAQEAAHEAGESLRKKQGHEQVLYKKARRDCLLDADIEAEKIIIDKLKANFPHYDILSEETLQESKQSPYQWVVDPLDGSFNFHHRSPVYGVSIGLRVRNRIEVAVVYLPFYDEMYTAIRSKGAYLNGKPIEVSSIADLDEACVHVGDFAKDYDPEENQIRLKDITHLANTVGRVRMIGTAATDLAYIACGRAEALVVHNALPWDIEVGALLITEAGGKVEFYHHPDSKGLTICSNSHIHNALFNTLHKAHGDAEYGALFCPIPA